MSVKSTSAHAHALEHTSTRATSRHTRYLYGVVLLALACFSLSDWTSSTTSIPSNQVSWPDSTLLYHHKPGTVIPAVCPENPYDNPSLDCGSVIVPKDYFNTSAGVSSIAFARIKATEPKKGSVFINPGGPGGSGVMLALRTPLLVDIIGPEWDIIGFDPRGIGYTRPATECFSSHDEVTLFNANTVIEQGITVSSIKNITSSTLRDELVIQFRQFLALKESQAKLCGQAMGDELKYMGTANVVRDMDFMSEIFDGEGAKINYWGGSYGSILGAYLVNMLPERVGYAVIDGIADPVAWANEPSHKWPANWVAHAEKTYDLFLSDCSTAGPALCPISKYKGEPIRDIEARLEAFFDTLAVSPLPVPFANRPGFLTSGAARNLLLIFLQRPGLWVEATHSLAEAINGNGTALHNYMTQRGGSVTRLGVTCIDSPPPESCKELPTPEDLAEEGLRALEEASIHFGLSTGISEPDGGCQFWPAKGPERFTGPWNATLEHPMLIVSNTHDPITPMKSGLLVNSLMPNSSVMLIQNGPGHCSLAMKSTCTIQTVRDYFSGIVPKNGTICEVDNKTFQDPDEVAATEMSVEAKAIEQLQQVFWSI